MRLLQYNSHPLRSTPTYSRSRSRSYSHSTLTPLPRPLPSFSPCPPRLRFNETLICRFPIKLIGEIADDIAASSLDPELLGVLAALSSSHGAQPHVEIQLQILRELTQPGRIHKVIFLANDPNRY